MFFLVPCAGFGSRMKTSIPKQYLMYNNYPIIYYTLRTLSKFNIPIVLLVAPNDNYIKKFNLEQYFKHSLNIQYIGGNTRAETVNNGLNYLQQNYSINSNSWVLVHDAARPLVKYQDILNLIDICNNINHDKYAGAILACSIVDSLKKANSDFTINQTICRENIYQAQTPQMFKLILLQNALKSALKENITLNDESSAIEAYGYSTKIICSDRKNIKITHPDDLEWLKFLD